MGEEVYGVNTVSFEKADRIFELEHMLSNNPSQPHQIFPERDLAYPVNFL